MTGVPSSSDIAIANSGSLLALYQSNRFFPGDGVMPAYSVPVPAGSYSVRLFFANTYIGV
jgi:hypothetical protein